MSEHYDNSLGKSDLRRLTALEASRRKTITIKWEKGGMAYRKTVPHWKDLFELNRIQADGGKNIQILPSCN
jgi:hypothetical protein